jgi:hypothetical protein
MKRVGFKKRVRATGLWLGRGVVLLTCLFISVFLLMSGYESVYSRSLPFVHTIDPVNLQAYADSYNLTTASHLNSSLYGSFGRPINVKLPERNERLDIAPPIYNNGWLARSNALHLLIPVPPRNGNIGTALLYCRSSFRTLNDQNLPSVGSNLFMDTDNAWRYVFKVTSAKVYADSVPYVASDNGTTSKLIISCNDTGAHSNVVVEANLLSVQGVDQ